MIKIGIVVAIFTFSLFASLTLFTLFGFDDVLREFIKSNVVMSPDTYDLWGANPGSSNTITVRNYTFYNFTNPRGYMYRGEMPRFT